MTNTRNEIIEKAFLLFLQKGFKAVKMRDIEDAVGITKGTFYYHFSSKDEVLKEGVYCYYAMLDSRRAQEFEGIQTVRQYVDLTIKKLTDIHDYSVKSFSSEIPEILCLTLMVQVLSLYPEFKKVLLTSKMFRISKLEQLILDAKKRGELKDSLDTSVLARNLLNIGVGVINYLLMHQDIEYALTSVRSQYEQLYALIAAE